MTMNWDDMRVFLAVADGGLSAAARHLKARSRPSDVDSGNLKATLVRDCLTAYRTDSCRPKRVKNSCRSQKTWRKPRTR